MESTLITATGHHPGKRGKQKGTLSHWVQSLNYKKTSSKERKIRLGKGIKAQGSIEVATQLSYPETRGQTPRETLSLEPVGKALTEVGTNRLGEFTSIRYLTELRGWQGKIQE